MQKLNDVVLPPFPDYEFIDSGDKLKLERYGKYTLIRPEPKALWKKSLPKTWQSADATYTVVGDRNGKWIKHRDFPTTWQIKWENLTFELRLTDFKHTGIFPENSVHWKWISEKVETAKRPINLLNLFGYTGGATLAASSTGAAVTHVDASKSTVTWARRNAELSGLSGRPIRWIEDDAVTFVRREINRGKKYDAIVLDPPKFGRSENGSVWKFEKDMPHLLDMCQKILSEQPLFILINAYTVEFSSLTLANMLESQLPGGEVEHGEVVIFSEKSLPFPTSIFARWTA